MKTCLAIGIKQTGTFLRNVACNLWQGVRLVAFLPAPKERFVTGAAYLWAAAFVLLATYCVLHFTETLSPAVFNRYGLLPMAMWFTSLLFGAFLAMLCVGKASAQWVFPVIYLNALWLPILIHYAVRIWAFPEGHSEGYEQYRTLTFIILFVIAFRSLIVAAPGNAMRQLMGAMAVVAVSYSVAHQYYDDNLWYRGNDNDEYVYSPLPPRLMAEDALSDQYALLDRELAAIAPRHKGKNYFVVTFGADDGLDVFMKEALFARAVLMEKFNAKGHVVTLINNPQMLVEFPFAAVNGVGRFIQYIAKQGEAQQVDSLAKSKRFPLATVANLRRTLEALATKAKADEDVLVLYLTSHGSQEASISVQLSGVELKQLSAEELKTMLDKSGFKWKVIIISACYSGSFVENVKDDYSIILTSSREDRVSYGCGKDDDLTYFGKALLEHAFAKTDSVIAAYELARQHVEYQEENAYITEHSQPQLYVGRNAKDFFK